MLDPGKVRRPLSMVESPVFQKLVSKIPVRSSDKARQKQICYDIVLLLRNKALTKNKYGLKCIKF